MPANAIKIGRQCQSVEHSMSVEHSRPRDGPRSTALNCLASVLDPSASCALHSLPETLDGTAGTEATEKNNRRAEAKSQRGPQREPDGDGSNEDTGCKRPLRDRTGNSSGYN